MSNICSHELRTARVARAPRPGLLPRPPLLASATAMTDVQPLRALHYEQSAVGEIADVVAPPYDVIDDSQRAALLARSPFNVVAVDLPKATDDGRRSLPGGRRAVRELAAAGRAGPRPRAGDLGAHAGVHGPRRRHTHPQRLLLPRAHRGLRPGSRASTRADAPGPEGGSPATHARDARQHLPDLLPLLRPAERRLDRARAGHRPTSRGPTSPTATARATGSGASPTRRPSPPSRRRPPTPSC